MKALITSILVFGAASAAIAQGQVNFSNLGQGVNDPATNASGVRIVGPSPYVADLFWSSNTNAAMDTLNAAGFNIDFSTSTINGGGYFVGASQILPVGEVATLGQVRVWDTTYAPTSYEARDKGGEFGFSNVITMFPQFAPGQPWPLLGLRGFQLQRLPHLTAAVTTTNTILFSWPVELTSYALQQNPDLSPTNWVTLSNQPVTVGQQQQVVLPVPPSGRMFYGLVSR